MEPTELDGYETKALEIQDPAKLLRLGSMIAATLSEVREVHLDAEGRRHLQQAHRRTVEELKGLFPAELRQEMDEDVILPLDEGTVSENELRVAQARLIGWLEGLFRGVQASALSAQLAAQLDSFRRQAVADRPGQYL